MINSNQLSDVNTRVLLLARHAVRKGKMQSFIEVLNVLREMHNEFAKSPQLSIVDGRIKSEIISELLQIDIDLLRLGNELNSQEIVNLSIEQLEKVLSDISNFYPSLSPAYASQVELYIQLASTFKASRFNQKYPFLLDKNLYRSYIIGAADILSYLDRLIRTYIIVKRNDREIELLRPFVLKSIDGLSSMYSYSLPDNNERIESWSEKIIKLRGNDWVSFVQGSRSLREEMVNDDTLTNSERNFLFVEIAEIEIKILNKTLGIYILAIEIYFNWGAHVKASINYNNPTGNYGHFVNSSPFIEDTGAFFELLNNIGFVFDGYRFGLIEGHVEITRYIYLAILVQLERLNINLFKFANSVSALDYDKSEQLRYVLEQLLNICKNPVKYFDSERMHQKLSDINQEVIKHIERWKRTEYERFEVNTNVIRGAFDYLLSNSSIFKAFQLELRSFENDELTTNPSLLIPADHINGLDKRLPGLLTSFANRNVKSALKNLLLKHLDDETISLNQHQFFEAIDPTFDLMFIDIISDRELYFDFWRSFQKYLVSDIDDVRYRIGYLKDSQVFNTELSNNMPPLAILLSKDQDTKVFMDVKFKVVKSKVDLQIMFDFDFELIKGSTRILRLVR